MTTPLIIIGVIVIVAGIVIWWTISSKKQAAAWQQLARELGGEFIPGGFLKGSLVRVPIKGRTATLDTYSVPSGDSSTTYTRIKVPYENKAGLEFVLMRRGIVAKLDKALGMKEIESGDAEFDHNYVIRGKDDPKVRVLFANQKIRELIQTQRSITLAINSEVLSFEASDIITDVTRLKTLFDLFKVMLDQLEG
jgi:hypothetical protein